MMFDRPGSFRTGSYEACFGMLSVGMNGAPPGAHLRKPSPPRVFDEGVAVGSSQGEVRLVIVEEAQGALSAMARILPMKPEIARQIAAELIAAAEAAEKEEP